MGIFIVYTNFEREGWHKTLCTSNKSTVEYLIKLLLGYEEKVEVIIKYKTDKLDYPLYSFCNKQNRKSINMEKAYQKMLSFGIK